MSVHTHIHICTLFVLSFACCQTACFVGPSSVGLAVLTLTDCLTADGGLYFEFFPRELGDGAGHEAVVEFLVGVAAAVTLFVARTSHQSRVLAMAVTMTHHHLVGVAAVAAVASVVVMVVRRGVQVS